jgi:integrase
MAEGEIAMTVRTVVRRGERRLVIDIIYTGPDGNSARYRKDAEVQTLAAARGEERRRLAELGKTGTLAVPVEKPNAEKPSEQTVTFAEASKKFLALYAESRLKPSTRRGYRVVLDSLLVPRLGKLELTEIGAEVVRELDRMLVKRGARPSTRRNIQCVLRAVRRFALELGLVENLPAFPPLPRVGATVRVSLTTDEVERLRVNVPAPYRLAFELAIFAGLRAGEVRGLRWSDVDLARGVLVVRRARCRDQEAPPKSGHERIIPLHATLHEALEGAGVGKGYVTGPKRGEPWGEFALAQAFTRYSTKAGITGFHFHDLRHAFVTELFRGGASAPVVQRLAGHEHLVTTQRYAHVTLDDLEAGIRGLRGNDVVTGGPDNR